MDWIGMALASAFFAGLTSILAKCGIKKTDSDIATAIRTLVVLAFSWIMVFVVGSAESIRSIDATSLVFLVLSGICTGASWICYFKALSIGDINKVVPIDKSSTVLSVILAIVFFGETSNLIMKLLSSAILAAGILLMVEKKESGGTSRRGWMLLSVLSAVFASLTSILAKIGVSDVESNLATAIRTGVVLILAWGIVFARKKHTQISSLDKRELVFIILSGICTGASWLCYYYSIQKGDVSVVVPVDKLSILVTVAFSYFVFREKLTKRSSIGLCLMVVGTLMMVWFK